LAPGSFKNGTAFFSSAQKAAENKLRDCTEPDYFLTLSGAAAFLP
jgi:hypothetical protein